MSVVMLPHHTVSAHIRHVQCAAGLALRPHTVVRNEQCLLLRHLSATPSVVAAYAVVFAADTSGVQYSYGSDAYKTLFVLKN